MGQAGEPWPAGRSPRRASRRLIGGVVAVVSAACLGTWFVAARWGNSTTPVAVSDVAAEFGASPAAATAAATSVASAGPTSTLPAASTATTTTAPSTTAPAPSPPVAPGVYRYASSGQEGIDVLDRPTHEYPSESAVVVTPTACGFRVEWLPLEERREWFEVCAESGGLRLVQYGGFHRFFGQDDERSMRCPSDAWLVAPAMQPGASTSTVCEGSGNTDRRTTTYLRRDAVLLDGVSVPVRVMVVAVEGSGATSSSSTRELWLTDGGLPVVWIDEVSGRSDSVVGPVNYTEYAELRATSLEPV